MVSENLSVKITADVSALQNGLKRVKKSLSEMTGEIKQSLPRLNTESRKAEVSLKEVSEAGDDVTKSLKNINTEVKKIGTSSIGNLEKSLSNISVLGEQTKENLKVDGSSLEGASESAATLQESLDTLRNLTVFDFIANGFSKIVERGKKLDEIKKKTKGLDKSFKEVEDAAYKLSKGLVDAMKSGELSTEDFVEEINNLKSSFANVEKRTQDARDKLDKEAQKLKFSFKNAFKSIGDAIMSTAGKMMTAAALIVSAFFAIRSAMRTANLGGEIYNSAQRAGMATDTYQRWTFILERNGIAIDELTEIMSTLTEAQVDVIDGTEDMVKAFEQLGMSQEDVRNMNQEQLWESTIAALQGVENTTERLSLAYKIFGEDASKLTTVLNMNSAEAQRLNNVYYQLGGNMSQNLIRLSAEYRASMTNLKTAFQGVKNTIAEALLPAIIAVIKWVTKAVAIVGMFLRTVFGINLSFKTANKAISSGASGIKKYGDSATGAAKAIEKLKRTTMGFDELNIVQNPNSSAGSSGGGSGAADVGGADYGAGLSAADSLIDVEDLGLDKWQAWFDKYKKIIQDITTWALIGIGSIGAVWAFMHGNIPLGIMFAAMAGIGLAVGSVEGGTFDRLGEKIKKAWTGIKNWFNSTVKPVFTKQFWSTLWDHIKTAWQAKVDEISYAIQQKWNGVKSWFNSTIKPIFTKAYWSNLFDGIRTGVSEKLNAVKSVFTTIWEGIKSWFNTSIAPKFTKTYWSTKFDAVRQSASDKITAVKTVFTNAWDTIKKWFTTNVASKFTVSYWSNKFTSIKDGARAAFNGVIAVVEKAVNSIINKINKLSWKIPDWVPSLGGKKFGFDMKTISIPRLATGGIVTQSTLANIGERGAEAVLPLTGSQSTAWMDMLSNKIADRIAGNSQQKVVLQVGEKELGWATIGAINGITKQTGGLQLAL